MGLLVFDALAMLLDKKQETIDWLRSCQLENGGFTYALHAMLAAIDHVDYTWAALKALKLLGAMPKDPAGVRSYLTSLWNHDGRFGDRPGRASNPLAMRQAPEALDILGHSEGLKTPHRRTTRPVPEIPKHFNVYSIQIEALELEVRTKPLRWRRC